MLDNISPETFPLPTLGPFLRSVATEVHEGRGLVILKGLDPDKYCTVDNVALYVGITSYIGRKRGVQGIERDYLSKDAPILAAQ